MEIVKIAYVWVDMFDGCFVNQDLLYRVSVFCKV